MQGKKVCFKGLLSTNFYLVVLRREYYDGLYKLVTAFMAEIIAGLPFLLVMPFLFGKYMFFQYGLLTSIL